MTNRREQRRIVEGLVLAAPEPVSAGRLAEIVPGATAATVRELVGELNAEYSEQGRAFEIVEVAGGWQVRTQTDLADRVRELHPRRPVRLSRASLETLAVVAYKQPTTRAEIDHVRGVDAGAVLRSLLERDLVRIAGHREIPGRPMLYATTRHFLEVFGLASLEDLPTLQDLKELGSGGDASPDEAPAAAKLQVEDSSSERAGADSAAEHDSQTDLDLGSDRDFDGLDDVDEPEDTDGPEESREPIEKPH